MYDFTNHSRTIQPRSILNKAAFPLLIYYLCFFFFTIRAQVTRHQEEPATKVEYHHHQGILTYYTVIDGLTMDKLGIYHPRYKFMMK